MSHHDLYGFCMCETFATITVIIVATLYGKTNCGNDSIECTEVAFFYKLVNICWVVYDTSVVDVIAVVRYKGDCIRLTFKCWFPSEVGHDWNEYRHGTVGIVGHRRLQYFNVCLVLFP